jgi:hypothetical protein
VLGQDLAGGESGSGRQGAGVDLLLEVAGDLLEGVLEVGRARDECAAPLAGDDPALIPEEPDRLLHGQARCLVGLHELALRRQELTGPQFAVPDLLPQVVRDAFERQARFVSSSHVHPWFQSDSTRRRPPADCRVSPAQQPHGVRVAA